MERIKLSSVWRHFILLCTFMIRRGTEAESSCGWKADQRACSAHNLPPSCAQPQVLCSLHMGGSEDLHTASSNCLFVFMLCSYGFASVLLLTILRCRETMIYILNGNEIQEQSPHSNLCQYILNYYRESLGTISQKNKEIEQAFHCLRK